MRSKATAPIIIQSKEGIGQGCPMSMGIYGIAMVPLGRMLQESERQKDLEREMAANHFEPTARNSVQAWFADDFCGAGRTEQLVSIIENLVKWGPSFGYFPSPEKSLASVQRGGRAIRATQL